MTAPQGNNEEKNTKNSDGFNKSIKNNDKIIVISKAPWYKEAAGTVAVIAWSCLLFFILYSLVTPDYLNDKWWYELSLALTAGVASVYRIGSVKVAVDNIEL